MKSEKHEIPRLQDILEEKPLSDKSNQLMVILNQPPKENWLKELETPKGTIKYIPIERIEWLLTYIYGSWKVEVRSVQELCRSIVVTIRLYVTNPVTREQEWQDGIGACAIAEKDPMGSQLAAPAAETYAVKDGAEKFGKIFGKDLNRADSIDYTALLKPNVVDDVFLRRMFEEKEALLSAEEKKSCLRVIDNKEHKSYRKINELLNSKRA